MYKIYKKFVYATLLYFALTSFCGALIYRFYKLNWTGLATTLALSFVLYLLIVHFSKQKKRAPSFILKKSRKYERGSTTDWLKANYLFILYFASLAALAAILMLSRTNASIISPWQTVPVCYFAVYFLAAFLLLLILAAKDRLHILCLSLFTFVSLSVCSFVYAITFGFDPHIHSATIDLIVRAGEVLPKTNYYLGQYSVFTILNKLFFIPLDILNKFFLPLFTALYIPLFLRRALNKWFLSAQSIGLTFLGLFILPFPFLISTTPQSVAYVELLLVILIGLTCKSYFDLALMYALALAAAATQPIAGLPALFLALAITVHHSPLKNFKLNLYRVILLLNTAALPLAFYFLERGGHGRAPALFAPFSILDIFKMPGRENLILNFVYLYIFNLKALLAALVIAGAYLAWKNRADCGIFFLYIGFAASMFLSAQLAGNLSFAYLIDYERSDFLDRINLTGLLFLLPVILVALHAFFERLKPQNKYIKNIFLAFFLMLITAAHYATYPRLDNYHNSHGYSTGQNDIDAVRWIDSEPGEDFIVLANQQVSAAALSEFGFKKYYNNDLFYYPIPTSSPLYEYYLQMVNETPSADTMRVAMDLAGVNTGYFVLNKYWWAFPKLLEEAKLEADFAQSFGQGEVWVFKYSLP